MTRLPGRVEQPPAGAHPGSGRPMSYADVAKVLAKCAAADKRTIGESDIAMWFETIGDLPLDMALAAVTRYYRDNRQPMMPADVRYIVEEMIRENAERNRQETLPGITGPARTVPGHSRGYLLTQHVLTGLARARAANRGPLGRQRAAEVAEELMREAVQRYPGAAATGAPAEPRGYRCARPGCLCTHGFDPVRRGVCDQGWIELPAAAGQDPQVTPCHVCFPQRAQLLRDKERAAALRTMRADRV